MKAQTQQTKLAEVKYRAQIASQHLGRSQVFANEPQASEFKEILKNRLKEADKKFKEVKKRHFTLSPYLEIGAEYAWAAALLENKYGAIGFASDISKESLANARYFAKIFKFKKVPKTICCDAYNLPFRSNSFPFVFVFESLHHLPDPKPVLLEIRRVLAPGGICLIGAEPIKQSFNLNLWRRPNKLRGWEKLLKLTLLLPFISKIGKTEVDFGIIENAFSLSTWQKAFSVFDKVEVKIKTPLGFSENIAKSDKKDWLAPSSHVKITLHFLGGGLETICYKSKSPKSQTRKDLNNLLICPDCKNIDNKEVSLFLNNRNFTCPSCHRDYTKIKDVLVLLEKNLHEEVTKIKNETN